MLINFPRRISSLFLSRRTIFPGRKTPKKVTDHFKEGDGGPELAKNFFSLSAQDIDGNQVNFNDWKNHYKAYLFVNTASE